MGIPLSYKRLKRSISPQDFPPPEMSDCSGTSQQSDLELSLQRTWAPLSGYSGYSSHPIDGVPAPKPNTLPLLQAVDTDVSGARFQEPQFEVPRVPSPMESLPESVLVKILHQSQPTAWDLCRLSCVSRRWRSACAHKTFWTRLRVGCGSLRPGVEQLAWRCSELAELYIDDPGCQLHILHPIVVACSRSLRRVVVDCDRGDGTSVRNEASISSLLWLISLYCKNVESIELQSNRREMTAGSLESKTMWYLTSALRKVRSFASLAQGSLTKQCIFLMAIAWRDLESVRLNMTNLVMEDLLAFRKCPSLRVMELVGGRLGPISPAALHFNAHSGSLRLDRQPLHHASLSTQLPAARPVARHPLDARELGICPETSSPVEDRPLNGSPAQRPLGAQFSTSRQDHETGQSPLWSASQLQLWREQGQEASQPGTAQVHAGQAGVPSGPASDLGPRLGWPLFHPTLELLVLNKMEFDVDSVAMLALGCPNLTKILIGGPLCSSCLLSNGSCSSQNPGCVRKKVDLIHQRLLQMREFARCTCSFA